MTRPAPAEFAEFVREVSIRALDRMAERVKEVTKEQRQVVRAWSRLSTDDKKGLLSAIIAAALASAPSFGSESSEALPKRDIRRYDPDEVASTLPAKPVKAKNKRAKSSEE